MTIPVTKIVSTLKVKTPPATKVSIDRVSKNSITIHWENEPIKIKQNTDQIISYYLLYLNNLQVAIFPNSTNSLYTCCSITGLEQETEYQLDFITVNNMGFINKLPSLYCMTKPNNLDQTSMKKSGNWRRNALTATVSPTEIPSVISAANNNTNSSPAYASLTNLKDLESYSIDDLKKILVCAQEDLHEVLSQQVSLLQDFKESKLQLELELDNLKNYWSHEIDLRKSLKSNIKSLENSKLLSDLKLEKLNKNIEQSNTKILKMQHDMKKWSKEESEQLNKKSLEKNHTESLNQLNNEIHALSKKIKSGQQEITLQEDKNKKLNSLKKISTPAANVDPSSTPLTKQQSSSSLSSAMQSTNADVAEPTSLSSFSKKISDATVEKTGLLNSSGDEMLSKLNPNSQAVKLMREQLRVDQELDVKWKSKRNRMLKRIETLETMFTEISLNNRQLRASLMVQPYAAQNNSDSNANSSLTLNESSPAINSPAASARSVIENINNPSINTSAPVPASTITGPTPANPHLILHNPSTYPKGEPLATTIHGSLLSPQINNSDTFSHAPPMTETILADATAANQTFPWGSEQDQDQQQHQQQQQQNEQQQQQHQHQHQNQQQLEQPFEYDNANHLISGLQNMIYDDYPESISNYSKGFTTDQLDNYWTNQIPITNTNQNELTDFATPFQSYGKADPASSSVLPFASSLGPDSSTPNLAPNQSLLAATLNDPSLSGFGDTLPMIHSDSFQAIDTTSNNHNIGSLLSNPEDSANRHNVLSSNMTTESPLQLHEESPFAVSSHESDSMNGNAEHHDESRLQSPRFNFIWHASQAPPATPKPYTTHHVRNPSNASNGSNASTWSKLNWKNWSPQASAAVEDVIDESSSSSLAPPPLQQRKSSTSPVSSSGRRMSKLLSRSGMNIFKLPSHEDKK